MCVECGYYFRMWYVLLSFNCYNLLVEILSMLTSTLYFSNYAWASINCVKRQAKYKCVNWQTYLSVEDKTIVFLIHSCTLTISRNRREVFGRGKFNNYACVWYSIWGKGTTVSQNTEAQILAYATYTVAQNGRKCNKLKISHSQLKRTRG